nr:trypsin-like peptidase domain-containing protein [Rhodovulum sp. P5]
MILSLLALCVLVLLLPPGLAAPADTALRRLETGVVARGWQAVGRLDIGQGGFCTGALVAPDLVLTAAHCLFDDRTGRAVDITEMEFRAGWRNGRAEAYRQVARGVVHSDYRYDGQADAARVAHDLALLQLDRAIRLPGVEPFATADKPRKGQAVGVVSYAQGRAEAPALQEVCHVLAGRPKILVLSCDVDFGSSGAPVFRIEDGVPRIVSVVSAKAEVADRKVALGTALGDELDGLRRRLAMGREVLGTDLPPMHRFGQGGAREASGAKFLRP